MKHTSSLTKVTQVTRRYPNSETSVGAHGIAIAPPAYDIAIVDHQTAGKNGFNGVIQRRAATSPAIGRADARTRTTTRLPKPLQAGLESLSGLSLDDVKLHYNSTKPAQVQALAYTQGAEIHLGPGQERHLSHEAWHVVQQKQGRVPPTIQTRGVTLNTDEALEREAEWMGARASGLRLSGIQGAFASAHLRSTASVPVIQRYTAKNRKETKRIRELRGEYIQLNGDDDEHYGPKFDKAVEAAATMDDVEQIVTKVKASKAVAAAKLAELHKSKASEPVAKAIPKPSTPSTPIVASTTSTPKPISKRTKFVPDTALRASLFGGSSYTPKPEPVVDPFAGLSSKVRPLAVAISQWNQSAMDGTSAKLSLTEQSELETWVTSQTTKGGKQKYIVNIGEGTGAYSDTWQFKVSGFASLGVKAATYHITLL